MSVTNSVVSHEISLNLRPGSLQNGSPPSPAKTPPSKPPKPQSIKLRKLCDRCSTLGLSTSKFFIGDDRSSDPKPSVWSLRLANERFVLGTLFEVKERTGRCRLCALISRPLPDSLPPHAEGALCHLIWEIDGRAWDLDKSAAQETEATKRTRRLRVCWDHPDLQQCESYLVLAAPSAYDNSDVNYRGLLNNETEFLGRRLGKSENKRNLIRELLRLCERYHDDRCTKKLGIEDDFHETLKEPYFGVIDIENDNLVPLPFKERDDRLTFESYAAVSYVWGDSLGRDHTTKISNIQSRRKSGGLASVIRVLPKALKQIIQLVHDLGIRYIWIDALCIVQDSSHSWNLNARAMHLIYGNAIFTLCAADETDANTGLLALDATHRPTQWIEDCADGLKLLLHQPPEGNIEVSHWNKRAWTFQERLLSKRCLIFAGGRIYFQCRSTAMSEDIFADRDGRGWSLDLLRSPLQMLSQLKLRAIWFYARCVSLYTKRDLYEPFDILSAFSGMCKLMEYTMQAPFSFGLPTSHFDFALLWQPQNKISRLIKPRITNDAKHKDTKFPSWSWCGWESDGISYPPEMVDGCLSDVRAWLLNHTWIQWHIRDGYGTLRRLWDFETSYEDESTSPRWKGYQPCPKVSSPLSIHDQTTPAPDPDSRKFGDGPRLQSQYSRVDDNTIRTNQRHVQIVEPDPEVASDLSSGDEYDYDYIDNYDAYGRPLAGSIASTTMHLPSEDFTLTLPEDPYHVRKTEAYKGTALSREFPDQIFLQFFTWKARFHIVPITNDVTGLSGQEKGLGAGLCRCHIMDRRGDKCGSIVVDFEWLRQKNLIDDGTDEFNHTASTEFEFIAISEAKTFTKEEFPDWTYYIPKERVESEWDLFFVLLLEYFPVEGFYRRVALGKAFKAAFSLMDDEWKEIILG